MNVIVLMATLASVALAQFPVYNQHDTAVSGAASRIFHTSAGGGQFSQQYRAQSGGAIHQNIQTTGLGFAAGGAGGFGSAGFQTGSAGQSYAGAAGQAAGGYATGNAAGQSSGVVVSPPITYTAVLPQNTFNTAVGRAGGSGGYGTGAAGGAGAGAGSGAGTGAGSNKCYQCSYSAAKTYNDQRVVVIGGQQSYQPYVYTVQGGWDKCAGPFSHQQALLDGIDTWDCDGNCYIRSDSHGNIYRGCYKGTFGVNPNLFGCSIQAGNRWCFCAGQLCNNGVITI